MQPIDYFALDVDIVSDPRIRKLTTDQGGVSFGIYIVVLCRVFSSQSGYYCTITPADYQSIATDLNCKPSCVAESIQSCFRVGLFTKIPQAPTVITSPSIQRRYVKLCKLVGVTPVLSLYRLIEPTILADRFPPLLEDVLAELQQNNWVGIVDPDEFITYYSSIDWKIKGEPITDWKQKLSKWVERRLHPQRKRRASKPEQTERSAYPAPTERHTSISQQAVSWDDFQKQLNSKNK